MDFTYLHMMTKHAMTAQTLSDPAIIANTIKPDVVFATVAYCNDVTAQYAPERGPRLEKTVQHASIELDARTITVGYLSHTNTNLLFQTPDAVIFDVPFSAVSAEEHSNGVLIRVNNAVYIFSSFYYINDQLSPKDKLSEIVMDNGSVWINELVSLGVIDKQVVQESKRKQRRTVLTVIGIWLVVIAFGYVGAVFFLG